MCWYCYFCLNGKLECKCMCVYKVVCNLYGLKYESHIKAHPSQKMHFKSIISIIIIFASLVHDLSSVPFYSEIISKIQNREISFLIFTRDSESQPYFLTPGNLDNLLQSPFEPGFQSKIIIHGFQSSCMSEVFTKIKRAYFSQAIEYNIMCVDWGPLAKNSYLQAIDSVWLVGVSLSLLLDQLVLMTSIDLEEVHIIGHSLGAHVAGVAGYNTELGNVGRITGLDPAVPMIAFVPETTLDKSDALIVEIIFTSMLSYGHPLGHINYFLNGGLWQPECTFADFEHKALSRQSFGGGDVVCSHMKAYEVFAEAVLCPDCFTALPCVDVSSAMDNKCCSDCGNQYFMFNLDFIFNGIYSVKTVRAK